MKRYNLEPLIQFKSRVSSCKWSDTDLTWTISVDHTLDDGQVQKETWVGRHLVLATGCLSAPNLFKFDGMDDFVAKGGKVYHTAKWPKVGWLVDFVMKRCCKYPSYQYLSVALGGYSVRRSKSSCNRNRFISSPVNTNHCRTSHPSDCFPKDSRLHRSGVESTIKRGRNG